MRGQRVTRSREGGHGQIIRFHGFPGLRVKPHGTAAGKQEKLAFRRQGNEFVRTGRSPLAAAAPHHQQVGIVKNVSLIIGHDHVRLHVFCHLILLTAGKRRQSRHMLLSYRENCKEAPIRPPAGAIKNHLPRSSPGSGPWNRTGGARLNRQSFSAEDYGSAGTPTRHQAVPGSCFSCTGIYPPRYATGASLAHRAILG